MNGNECMNANRRDFLKGALPTGAAALVLALAALTAGAAEDMSDDLPTSVVTVNMVVGDCQMLKELASHACQFRWGIV